MPSDSDTIEITPLPSPVENSWAFFPPFPAYRSLAASCPHFWTKFHPLPPPSSPLPPATILFSSSELYKDIPNENVGTTHLPKYLPGIFRALNSRRLSIP